MIQPSTNIATTSAILANPKVLWIWTLLAEIRKACVTRITHRLEKTTP